MSPSQLRLFWYFWRLSRWNIVLLITICTATMALVAFGTGESRGAAAAYGNILFQVFLIVSVGGIGIMQGRERAFLPSPYLMTLPMTTGQYLSAFYAYLIVVVTLVSCLVSALHFKLFGNVIQGSLTEITLDFWEIPLLCVCLVCMIQSMYHLSGIRNELLFIPLGIAMILLAFVRALPLLDPGDTHGHSITRLSLAALFLAGACSYGSLKAYRCGRYDSAIDALMSWLETGKSRTQAFTTPERALFWFGWRRHGRIFLFGTLGFCLLSWAFDVNAAFGHDARGFYITSNADEILSPFVYMPILLSAAFLSTVVSLLRDNADFFKGRGAFLFTLPVRSAALARGRLLAMAASLTGVIAVTLAALLSAAVLMVTVGGVSINMLDFLIYGLGLLLLTEAAAWIAIWFTLVAMPLYVALLVVQAVSLLLFGEQQSMGTVLVMTLTGTVALAVLGILAAAFRRGVMDRANVLLLVVTLVPASFVPIFLSSRIPEGVAVLCVASFLIALPFAAIPLALDRIRHH